MSTAGAREARASTRAANQTADLVRDLHQTRPGIYWTDLLLSLLIGWGAFAATMIMGATVMGAFTFFAAVLALYRALCFIHEISHQSRRSLPGFEAVWNLTTGFPLLLPSLMYAGVHSNHHRLSTYGTASDPEYLPFARSAAMTVAFAAQSLLLPIALAIRFLVFSPIAFAVPRFERWLVAHFSSLSMNIKYRREVTPETLRMIRRQSALILILWAVPVALTAVGRLPLRFFGLWYLVSAAISLINSLRTLGAHEYQSEGYALTREEQTRDSIDTPAVRWGILWAPVGLRFHSLHHYFPGIPYHNLREAYRRLTAGKPGDTPTHGTYSRSLIHSLTTLYRKGLRHAR
jgi:fatty acid desaturase